MEILELLKAIKDKFEGEMFHFPDWENYLCHIAELKLKENHLKQFSKYLYNNYPLDYLSNKTTFKLLSTTVFVSNDERLKWLDEQIEIETLKIL
tara:strand:+ start:294 stop:575 length:282 start_codon:yes stop_codon:yes gene_type:complete